MPPKKVGAASLKAQEIEARQNQNQQFFLSSIRDPFNPKHCGICLDGAFAEYVTTVPDKNPALSYKKSGSAIPRSPDFWNGVLAFVLLKRTDKQLERLLTRLSVCSCKMDGQSGLMEFHAMGGRHVSFIEPVFINQKLDPETFNGKRCALFVNIFTVFNAIINKTIGVKSAAKGTSTSWPLACTDLIPYGPDNFVQTMIQWYRFVPVSTILRTTALVLRMCKSILIPSLIKYQFTNVVVQSSRKLVDDTMADILTNDNETKERAAKRFEDHAVDVILYFKICTDESGGQDCMAALLRGFETKAMQVCSMMCYLEMDPALSSRNCLDDTQLAYLMSFVRIFYRFFHMHLPPRPDMPVHPNIVRLDNSVFPPPASSRSLVETALFMITDCRSEERCSAYGCLNSIQSAGRDFQRCASCAVVSYCGRECQTKAWKEEKYPHKNVCRALRNVLEKGGGADCFFKCASEKKHATHNLWAVDPLVEMRRNIIQRLKTWQNTLEDDLQLIEDWHKYICDARIYPMPDGTEWTPGYDDYNEVIEKLSGPGRSLKPQYMNRLARWPSEVAKEERLLKQQPFWQEDIE